MLSGDLNEADRHAIRTAEWIRHYYSQNQEYRRDTGGPERVDVATLPLCYIATNRPKNALAYLRGWKPWYAFEVCKELLGLLDHAQQYEPSLSRPYTTFLTEAENDVGVLAAVLSFKELDPVLRREFVLKLAAALRQPQTIEFHKEFNQTKERRIEDGLFKSAAIGISLGLRDEANLALLLIPEERPHLWSMSDRISNDSVVPFLMKLGLTAAANSREVREKEVLPRELFDLVPEEIGSADLTELLTLRLEERYKQEHQLPKQNRTVTYEFKGEATEFLAGRLPAIVEIVRAFSDTMSSDEQQINARFVSLLDLWGRIREKRGRYGSYSEVDYFLDGLIRRVVLFALWCRADLDASSVCQLLSRLDKYAAMYPQTLIAVVETLAKRVHLQEQAGKVAVTTLQQIQLENDIELRTALFAGLSRAILPASTDEASHYFQAGLEQLDAIGSGDYRFTIELLLFASVAKGDELDDFDVHTLTNICELNIPDESEKFPWPAFAQGLSGCPDSGLSRSSVAGMIEIKSL